MTANIKQKINKLRHGSAFEATVLTLLFFLVILSGCSESGGKSDEADNSNKLPLAGTKIIVMAASDLTDAFQEIGRDFKAETGIEPVFAFGSSGQLSEGILNGGRADVFASASGKYVDPLVKNGLADEKNRAVYALGKIVIMTQKNKTYKATGLSSLTDPAFKKVVIANPDHAPYGLAAKQVLEREALWESIKPKLVLAENVKQAMAFVETGNTEAGIVALSLVINSGSAELVEIPTELYDPIEQTMVVLKGSSNKAAADQFMSYVTGPKGKSILKKYGFGLPTE